MFGLVYLNLPVLEMRLVIFELVISSKIVQSTIHAPRSLLVCNSSRSYPGRLHFQEIPGKSNVAL